MPIGATFSVDRITDYNGFCGITEKQIASVKQCFDAGFPERLKVKNAVLSLTVLDPTVMSQHISVSKHIFITIALSVPDRFMYSEYLYVFNPTDSCCFQSNSQHHPFIVLICETVSQAVSIYFRVLMRPAYKNRPLCREAQKQDRK